MKKLIIFFALLPLALAAQSYSVGHTQITYNDPARSGRSIQTELYYPAGSAGTGVPVSTGSFPVIVFGHGFVMTWDAYQNFWDDLVPKGYIIAFPRTEGSFSPSHSEFGKDLAFLVNKLQSESASNPASIFYGHINSRSAIMGHSMGGGSSFLAAESNPNITTMISFAAANTTPSSITAAQNVSVPSLVFSGENDCVAPPATNQSPMFDSLASSCKTFIGIKGAAHCEFANYNFNCAFGESTCSPAPAITRTQQQDATSDFLNLWLSYFLKDDCNAWTVFNDSLAASVRIDHVQQCTIGSPVITLSGTTLTATPGTTYQWFYNGNPVSGANSQTLSVTAAGNYYVEETYYNGCSYQSNTISVTATMIADQNGDQFFLVYPNPVNENLQIIFGTLYPGKGIILLSDIQGRLLYTKEFDVDGTEMQMTLDLSWLMPGTYILDLTLNAQKRSKRILKK